MFSLNITEDLDLYSKNITMQTQELLLDGEYIKEKDKKIEIEKEEEVDQNISTAERTGGIIEPLPKVQSEKVLEFLEEAKDEKEQKRKVHKASVVYTLAQVKKQANKLLFKREIEEFKKQQQEKEKMEIREKIYKKMQEDL